VRNKPRGHPKTINVEAETPVAPDLTLITLGCDQSGKTTLVSALSGKPRANPEPTNGFSKSTARRAGSQLSIFDVGGGPQIRGIWKSYYASVHAAIFLVDASDATRLEESRALLMEAATHDELKGKPLLILANKQDVPQAARAEEIAEVLRLHELTTSDGWAFHVSGGSLASDYSLPVGSEIDNAINWLLNTAQAQYPKLQMRVEADLAREQEREQRKREERKARLAAKKAAREREEAEAAVAAATAPPSTVGVDVDLPQPVDQHATSSS